MSPATSPPLSDEQIERVRSQSELKPCSMIWDGASMLQALARIDNLKAELERCREALSRQDALEKFFTHIWSESCDCCEIDTCTVQEKALELGLAVQIAYDPDRHGEMDCERGDEIYVRSDSRLSGPTPTAPRGDGA